MSDDTRWRIRFAERNNSVYLCHPLGEAYARDFWQDMVDNSVIGGKLYLERETGPAQWTTVETFGDV